MNVHVDERLSLLPTYMNTRVWWKILLPLCVCYGSTNVWSAALLPFCVWHERVTSMAESLHVPRMRAHTCVCVTRHQVCMQWPHVCLGEWGPLLTVLPASSLLLSSASISARRARFCRSSSSRASCSSSSARVSDRARASRSRPSASTRSRSSTARSTAAFSSARSFRVEGDGVGETD